MGRGGSHSRGCWLSEHLGVGPGGGDVAGFLVVIGGIGDWGLRSRVQRWEWGLGRDSWASAWGSASSESPHFFPGLSESHTCFSQSNCSGATLRGLPLPQAVPALPSQPPLPSSIFFPSKEAAMKVGWSTVLEVQWFLQRDHKRRRAPDQSRGSAGATPAVSPFSAAVAASPASGGESGREVVEQLQNLPCPCSRQPSQTTPV